MQYTHTVLLFLADRQIFFLILNIEITHYPRINCSVFYALLAMGTSVLR